MTSLSYISGQLVPSRLATVPMEDRGYQFADGVYEVAAYFNHTLVDDNLHWDRLERSLSALHIAMPVSRKALEIRIAQLVRANRRRDGIVYLQVTRGVQRPRNHVFPKDLKPHLTIQILPARPPARSLIEKGVSVITVPDERWARCDIKTICLLPNIMARSSATKAGAREAWQVNAKGEITEGTLSNAYIVSANGTLRTHPATPAILGGVTRDVILSIARAQGITIEETAFTKTDAYAAKEAFMTSATSNVLPITMIDEKTIGDGTPGSITQQLLTAYLERIYTQTGKQL